MPPGRPAANVTATEFDASPAVDDARPDYRVGALAKGLRVLTCFDEQHPDRTVSDLVEATGFPMPTVYRLVMTLVGEGYLDQLPSGEYRPSVRALVLGASALRSLDLVAIATPELQRLGIETGETINLAVLDGDQILYLIRLRNSDLVTANIQVGSRLPAVSTSIGKLLLAALDDDQIAAVIGDESFLAATGPNAIRSLDELRRELGVVRSQHWAIQDEELSYGLRSISAPVVGPAGRTVAGVNVAVQAREWSVQRLLGELLPAVQATCTKISTLIGGPGVG
jgi:IclR family pca regulon transcriptional regulator